MRGSGEAAERVRLQGWKSGPVGGGASETQRHLALLFLSLMTAVIVLLFFWFFRL